MDVHFFNTTGSVFAMMGNGDGGTGTAFVDVLTGLYPVFASAVTQVPTQSCVTPSTTTTAPPTVTTTAVVTPAAQVTPVVARPNSTG